MKLDMGQAWNDALALLRNNQQVVLIVAGVFFFLPNLALMLLMPQAMGEAETRVAGEPDFDAAFQTLGTFYGEIWWQLLLISLLGAVGMLGLLALLTDRRRPTVGEALKTGVLSLPSYVAAQLLIGVLFVIIVMIPLTVGASAGAGAGALVGIVAAVVLAYVWIKLSLTVPVIVIDGVRNPVRALGRSWALTKGNSFRLFLFFLLLLVVVLVVGLVLGIVGALLGFLGGEDMSVIVNGLINAAINMVGITLYLAILAAVHRQFSGPSAAAVSETFE